MSTSLSYEIEVYTANFGRGVAAATFEQDAQALLEALPKNRPWLVGIQELDEADGPDEHELLFDLMMSHSQKILFHGWRQAVPVLANSFFQVNRLIIHPASQGVPKISPHRVLVDILYGPLVEGGPDHAHLNIHLPVDRPQTAKARRECRKVIRREVRDHLKHGHSVTLTTDSNTHEGGFLRLVRPYRAIDHGIDKVYAWAPRGWKVEAVGPIRRVPFHIDSHDGLGRRLRWTKKRVA